MIEEKKNQWVGKTTGIPENNEENDRRASKLSVKNPLAIIFSQQHQTK